MKTAYKILFGTLVAMFMSCTYQTNAGKNETLDNAAKVKQHSEKTPIVLDAFQIVDSDGGSTETALSMNQDGKCYLGKQFIGTITTSGQLKSEDGQIMLTLQGEQLLSEKGKVIVIIKQDGAISIGSEKDLSWGTDGILKNSESGLQLVPADTKAKRAASMLLSAFMGFSMIETK